MMGFCASATIAGNGRGGGAWNMASLRSALPSSSSLRFPVASSLLLWSRAIAEPSLRRCFSRASEQSPGLVGEEALSQIKSDLFQALEGINRGIFGVPSAKKSEIEGLVKHLEFLNPTPDPTLNLEKVAGCWKLVYSTITILGSKRTKLGLRDFISLGDFFQTIDVDKSQAVNVIKFNVRGFKMLDGKLTIEASFKSSSTSRVDINYNSSCITPDQLMNVFRKNYDLLLSIFNPEGWLEITFVDDTMRIGRDDKGNIFILERYG